MIQLRPGKCRITMIDNMVVTILVLVKVNLGLFSVQFLSSKTFLLQNSQELSISEQERRQHCHGEEQRSTKSTCASPRVSHILST